MWPWGHLAIGYLLYSGIRKVRGRPVSGRSAVLVAVGTQLPDVVDKPLAWTFDVLPTGRTLAHSTLALLVVYASLVALTDWTDGRRALGIGWLSHLLADAVHPLLKGDLHHLVFLVWPVLGSSTYETPQAFIAHLTGIDWTPFFWSQFVLVALAGVAWYRNGAPGIDLVWGIVRTGASGR